MDRWVIGALFTLTTALGGWAWSSTADRITVAETKLAATREELASVTARAEERYVVLVANIARVEKQVDNVHALVIQLKQR